MIGERIKRELGVPVMVGGHHAQAIPEYVIDHDWVDFVCTGEGELALLEVVERMARGAGPVRRSDHVGEVLRRRDPP